jgi:hypothetical protein
VLKPATTTTSLLNKTFRLVAGGGGTPLRLAAAVGGGATGGGGNPSRRSFSTRLRNQWKPTFALEAMVCNRSSAMVEKDCENWTEPKIPVKAAVEGEDRGGDV